MNNSSEGDLYIYRVAISSKDEKNLNRGGGGRYR